MKKSLFQYLTNPIPKRVKNFLGWVAAGIAVLTFFTLVISLFNSVSGILHPSDITPVNRMILYANQFVPDQDKCVIVSPRKIKEVTSHFLELEEKFSEMSFTFFGLNSQYQNTENEYSLSFERLQATRQEYLEKGTFLREQMELDLKNRGLSFHNIDYEIISLDVGQMELVMKNSRLSFDNVVTEIKSLDIVYLPRITTLEEEYKIWKNRFEEISDSIENESKRFISMQFDFFGWWQVNSNYFPPKYQKNLFDILHIYSFLPAMTSDNREELQKIMLNDNPGNRLKELFEEKTGITLTHNAQSFFKHILSDPNLHNMVESLIEYSASEEAFKDKIKFNRKKAETIINDFLKEYYGTNSNT